MLDNTINLNRVFRGNIKYEQVTLLETLLTKNSVPQIKNILNTKELSDFQTIGAAYAYISNQALLGDDPGLGKTIQAAAFLKLHELNGTLKKTLFITESSAIYQIVSEIYIETGLTLLPVYGDAKSIDKKLSKYDYREFDGILTTHSAVGVGNQFLRRFLPIKHEFNTIVYDESAAVANNTSIRHLVAKGLFKYFDNKLMLNGTALTTKLDQLYNQINVLNPTVLPKLSAINNEYGVYAKKNYFTKGLSLVDYKNEDDFVKRIRYNYLGRSRKQVGIDVDHSYNLHLVEQTEMQKMRANNMNYNEIFFNTTSRGNKALKELPALEKLLELTKERLKDGNVVIFAEYINIKPVIKELLETHIKGCKVGIIDGAISNTEGVNREDERLKFENGDYNVMIINITKAINLGSAKSMILYTIPDDVYQALLRIDRGLKGGKKQYDIIAYNDSRNITDITGRFLRQENLMNKALGKSYQAFNTICQQLTYINNMYDIIGE